MTEKLTIKEKNLELNDAKTIWILMQRILSTKEKITQDRENLWLISLNQINKIKSVDLISQGSIREVISSPMEIFSTGLLKRAQKLILIHNHPSGKIIPSQKDIELTEQLVQIGQLLNVPILDHVIIGLKKYYSFIESGIMKELVLSFDHLPKSMILSKINYLLKHHRNYIKNDYRQ